MELETWNLKLAQRHIRRRTSRPVRSVCHRPDRPRPAAHRRRRRTCGQHGSQHHMRDSSYVHVRLSPKTRRVPLLACSNTVRNKFAEFLHKTVASEATSWSAGAVLPPSAGEAVLRPLQAGSMASGPQSASMAGALQGAAASILITSRKKSRTVLGLSSSGTRRLGGITRAPPSSAAR